MLAKTLSHTACTLPHLPPFPLLSAAQVGALPAAGYVNGLALGKSGTLAVAALGQVRTCDCVAGTLPFGNECLEVHEKRVCTPCCATKYEFVCNAQQQCRALETAVCGHHHSYSAAVAAVATTHLLYRSRGWVAGDVWGQRAMACLFTDGAWLMKGQEAAMRVTSERLHTPGLQSLLRRCCCIQLRY